MEVLSEAFGSLIYDAYANGELHVSQVFDCLKEWVQDVDIERASR